MSPRDTHDARDARDSAPSRSDPTPAPTGPDHRERARERARESIAPSTKEPPNASVLETLGSAITQPIRVAAAAKNDKQPKQPPGSRKADDVSADGSSKKTPVKSPPKPARQGSRG